VGLPTPHAAPAQLRSQSNMRSQRHRSRFRRTEHGQRQRHHDIIMPSPARAHPAPTRRPRRSQIFKRAKLRQQHPVSRISQPPRRKAQIEPIDQLLLAVAREMECLKCGHTRVRSQGLRCPQDRFLQTFRQRIPDPAPVTQHAPGVVSGHDLSAPHSRSALPSWCSASATAPPAAPPGPSHR